MADDGGRYLLLVEELRAACREVAGAAEHMDHACARLVDDVRSGTSVLEAYRTMGTGPRDRIFATVARLEQALTATRAEGIRIMVDQNGASLSEVARMIGRSRQFVTRLYRSAHDAGDPPPEEVAAGGDRHPPDPLVQ